MKGMIFAAGMGTRLKPFTEYHPKALVPVGGTPMLERVILKLVHAGVSQIVVNVHHFAEQIIDFVKSKDSFGVDVHISDESGLLLDTGGGVLAARQWLDDGSGESVLVHNADILTDFSLTDFMAYHDRSKSDATLLVQRRQSSRQLYFDRCSGFLCGWKNFTSGAVRPDGFVADVSCLDEFAFGGVHILSPSVFPLLERYAADKGDVFSIIPFYLDNIAELNVGSYSPQGSFGWHDVGSPDKLSVAEAYLLGDVL